MRSLVLVFPGSNCDKDIGTALTAVGFTNRYHSSDESSLPSADLYVLPGGFAWGDYLRAGAIAARSPAMKSLAAQAQRGFPILAICNGFQMVIEAGLLPGALTRNIELNFICQHQHLRVEQTLVPFTKAFQKGSVLSIPIAHAEGRYIAEPETLARLKDNNQIVLTYCDADGRTQPSSNPNGSTEHIAGLTNKTHNLFALMPHPERAVHSWHGSVDGRRLLASFIQNDR